MLKFKKNIEMIAV